MKQTKATQEGLEMITVEQAIELGISKAELESVCLHCRWDVDTIEDKVKGVGRWGDYDVFLGEVSNYELLNSKRSYLEFKMRIYQKAVDLL